MLPTCLSFNTVSVWKATGPIVLHVKLNVQRTRHVAALLTGKGEPHTEYDGWLV